jgi:LytS/YehU family sensor histidine kinase
MVYVAVVGTLTALRWYEEWRTAQVQAAQMREDLTRAQLQALQAQLNPHFLFNALNAVVTLIKRDPAAAERTTIRLADLLRATLTVGDESAIALVQELELTGRYLEIEQVRFPDRLRVEWQIPDDVRELSVPPFTLQPLVENAVRHAVSRNPDGGTITVIAARNATLLVLTVRDEGAGADNASARNNGTGSAVRNLRSRLQRAYGEHASLDMRERSDGGTDVVVQLPITLQRGA